MHSLLKANIKKSTSREPDPFDLGSYASLELAGSSAEHLKHVHSFIYGPLPRTPWFFLDSTGSIRSEQAPYFGLYALTTMIVSVLRAVGFSLAGDKIPGHLYSPAILCYYTSAYHTLTAYLASMGRVLVERVLGRPKISVRGDGASYGFSELMRGKSPIALLAGVLTAENHWIFEPRNRSHRTRWNELFLIPRFADVAPRPVVAIAEYLSEYGGQLRCAPGEVLEYGVHRIPEIRHEATYLAFGADEFSLDLAMNQESGGGGTEIRRESIGEFARNWMNEMLSQTRDLIVELAPEMHDRCRSAIRSTALWQSTELSALSGEAKGAHEEIVSFIFDLEKKTRPSPPGGSGGTRA